MPTLSIERVGLKPSLVLPPEPAFFEAHHGPLLIFPLRSGLYWTRVGGRALIQLAPLNNGSLPEAIGVQVLGLPIQGADTLRIISLAQRGEEQGTGSANLNSFYRLRICLYRPDGKPLP